MLIKRFLDGGIKEGKIYELMLVKNWWKRYGKSFHPKRASSPSGKMGMMKPKPETDFIYLE